MSQVVLSTLSASIIKEALRNAIQGTPNGQALQDAFNTISGALSAVLLGKADVDYTNVDFEGALEFLRNEALSRLQKRGVNIETIEEADILGVITELFALIWDMLSYYQDANAREAFFTEALTRPAVRAGGKAIGYSLGTATPASTNIEIHFATALALQGRIPKGSLASASVGEQTIYYEVLQEVVIEAGATKVTVPVTEGRTYTDTYDAEGQESQVYELLNTPYLEGTLSVLQNNEGGWSETESFFFAGADAATGKKYILEVEEDGRARVLFGDGRNGVAPNGTLTLTYRVGGGKIGNVIIGAIDTWLTPIVLSDGSEIMPSEVLNPAKASGGLDQEALEEAKIAAVGQLRANSRTICLEDYEANAVGRDTGIVRAFAANYEMDPLGIMANTIRLFILPASHSVDSNGQPTITGPEWVTGTQANLVWDKLTNKSKFPRSAVVRLEIKAPKFKNINFTGVVNIRKGYSAADVEQAVLTKFSKEDNSGGFFDYLRKRDDGGYALQWGTGAYLSEIIGIFQSIPGVRNVVLTSPVEADLQLDYDQMIGRGTFNLEYRVES